MTIGSLFGFTPQIQKQPNRNISNKSIPQYNSAKNISFSAYRLVGTFKDPNYSWLTNFIYELSNKQRVIIVPKKGPGALSVKTVVRTGSLNERDEQRGISHFLEHCVFNGSKGLKPGAFDKLMESKGAQIDAHTGTDITGYSFDITEPKAKELSQLVSAHAQLVKYPELHRFEKEKEVVIQEIKRAEDQPASIQYQAYTKTLLGIRSKADHLVLGAGENIKNMTKQNVFDYHRANYVPNNMETYIVGDVDHEEAIKLVDKFFDTPDFRPSSAPRIHEEIRPLESTKLTFLSDPKIQTSNIIMGFVGPENSQVKETFALKALLGIMGQGKNARINKKLSQFATECDSHMATVSNHPKHPQTLSFFLQIKPGQEQAAINSIRQAIGELKDSPITQEELETIKKVMLDEFNSTCEESQGISTVMEDLINTGGVDAYKNYAQYINDLTIEDLNNAAKKYLNTQKSSISILQPEKAQNKNISFQGRELITRKFLTEHTLPNKLQLIINDNINALRMAMNFKIQSNAKAKIGTGDILVRMLQTSTARHSEAELAKIKSRNGANNLVIIATEQGLLVKTESSNQAFPSALKIIKEMIFEPKLNEENFEKAKKEIMLELEGTSKSAYTNALETMYKGTNLAITPEVLRQELGKVTLQDVQQYYKDMFTNPQAHAVITGPISKTKELGEKIKAELCEIKQSFDGKLSKGTKLVYSDRKHVIVQTEKGRTQSQIIQLFHLDTDNLQDIAALKVLDSILGSSGLNARLFSDLREKQKLCYSVGSQFNKTPSFAQEILIIETGIKDENGNVTNNIEKSILGFEKHIKMFIQKPPTKEELARVKRIIKSNYAQMFATALGQNEKLTEGLYTQYGAAYYDELLKAIDAITARDVQRVAKKYLTKPSVTSILTTEEAAAKAQAFLKTRGEFKLYPNEEA